MVRFGRFSLPVSVLPVSVLLSVPALLPVFVFLLVPVNLDVHVIASHLESRTTGLRSAHVHQRRTRE